MPLVCLGLFPLYSANMTKVKRFYHMLVVYKNNNHNSRAFAYTEEASILT